MIQIENTCNSAVVYSDSLDSGADGLIRVLCGSPASMGSTIRIMPDVHAGKGCAVGTTMTILDRVAPGLVGPDIGCGMTVLKFRAKRLELQKLDKLIHEKIPAGRTVRSMKGQVTMLRRNSLRCLLRELEEAKEKVKAYSQYYLPHYIKNLEKRKSRGELEPPESFSFVLPENYFYTGKLIYMKKKDLLTDGTVKINSDESLRYKFSESDFIEDLPSECLVPVMCDDFLGAPDFARVLSARKGYFKNVIATNPKIGISATVTGYSDRKQIILDYNGCVELRLPRGNLSNEKRFPPIGATIRVYPINWSYNLYYPVEVSERTSDSYLCFSFDDLPIVFSPSQWKEFESKLAQLFLLHGFYDQLLKFRRVSFVRNPFRHS